MENQPKIADSTMDECKDRKYTSMASGLHNITNKPIDAMPSKPSFPLVERASADKENPAPTSIVHRITEVDPTPASLRKPALAAPHKEHMEQQFDLLQGRLHSIKRESRRPSISGYHEGSALTAPATGIIPVARAPLALEAPPVAMPTTSGMDSLAAKLESLKRETVRPTFAPISAPQAQFESGGQCDMHALSRSAHQLFSDANYIALCEKGLNAQLTRSKDGATEETKIKELAGIVKVLRRAMKESQQRTQIFIEQCVRFEREAAHQVESVKLSSESAAMAAHAELANARREAASATANHKSALATWQGEIDLHRSEAATLRREMERVESERDRAREETRKVEVSRTALEGEIKELRKSQAQKDRELQVDKNSAAQLVYEAREAAERQRVSLSESLAAAQARGDEAEAAREALKEQLKTCSDELALARSQLASITEERDGLVAEKENLLKAAEDLRESLASQRTTNEKLSTDGAAALNEMGEWQQKAADLLTQLERERSVVEEKEAALNAASENARAERAAWQTAKEEYEVAVAEAKACQEALAKEKDELKSALNAALEKGTVADSSAQEAQERVTGLENTIASLTTQCDDLTAEVEALRRSEAAAQDRAAGADASIARIAKEAEEKANKLAQLEGELEALQECTMGLEIGDQRELLNRMVTKIAALESAVASAELRRREAHNQLVEMKGNIRVFCRIRPHPRSIATVGSDGSSVKVLADNKEHLFGFDRTFKPNTTQAAIFDEVSDVVQSALDGYKVCLFSYGQTGAGKTHTMQGNSNRPGEEGIIPRAISKILATVARLRDQGWEYSLEASYIEVYNEQLRDLLGAGRITENNAIQHAPNGGHTTVLGATRAAINSEEDADALVQRAASCRAVESTAMNAVSSRSHSIFMLYITGRHEATDTLLQGSLNLVDLAGSERLNRSQAEGQRAREACSINKSLSSLGDVFTALAAKQTHIPYRNSKLTHLLQPCLGGSGKTLMFVNINPEPESSGESLCSLRFAAKVNACETAAKGGATRNVSSSGDGFTQASAGAFDNTNNRPSLTGRASVAVPGGMRRQSVAPAGFGSSSSGVEGRRMSMIPSAANGAAGTKRRAMGPPAAPSSTAAAVNSGGTSRVARPRLN